jgi:hypothetical protein
MKKIRGLMLECIWAILFITGIVPAIMFVVSLVMAVLELLGLCRDDAPPPSVWAANLDGVTQQQQQQPAQEHRNQQDARAQQAREQAQREEQRQREREEWAEREQRSQREQRERERQERAQKKKSPGGARQWWEVLGVSQRSSEAEVKAAYRKKIKQCHPDRVMGLGKKKRQLAEREARELIAAFAAFNKARRCASA